MKRLIIWLSAGIVLITAGVTAFVLLARENATLAFNSDELTFIYSDQLEELPLSEQDVADNFVVRLGSIKEEQREMLVTARTESGFASISALTQQEPLDIIFEGIDKSYPTRFPGFAVVSEQRFRQDERAAADIVFTYDSPGGGVAKQRLLIVVRDSDTAVYVSAQALENHFDDLDQAYFDPLFESITFSSLGIN